MYAETATHIVQLKPSMPTSAPFTDSLMTLQSFTYMYTATSSSGFQLLTSVLRVFTCLVHTSVTIK